MVDSVNALLTQRLKKPKKSSKMTELGNHSATGNLTSFSGIFSVVELNESEKELLEAILHEFSTGNENLNGDLAALTSITSEVKAINNQAAILHGERIKRAQDILKKYQEGAFTSWLIAAYGNRQTPYNFLQYYEFYSAMPKTLRPQIEIMPRQAIYTLASRDGSLDKKRQIIENYKGETKTEVLHLIREIFPLPFEDRRKENIGEGTIRILSRLMSSVRSHRATILKTQKREIFALLDQVYELVESCKTR